MSKVPVNHYHEAVINHFSLAQVNTSSWMGARMRQALGVHRYIVWALPSHALSPAEEMDVNSLSLCSLFLSSSVLLLWTAEARLKRNLPQPWAVQRAQLWVAGFSFPMFLPEGPNPLSWCTWQLAPLLSSESPFWLGNKRCFHMLSQMQGRKQV